MKQFALRDNPNKNKTQRTMKKIDLKSLDKALYAPSAKVATLVEVPEMLFLMLDGAGNPNTSPHFPQAVETLFTVSYTLKFLAREAFDIDYGVLPLEGLWWSTTPGGFDVEKKDDWLYTVMMRQPDFITFAHIEDAIARTATKKKLPLLGQLRSERFHEGHVAQIMHIGPFSDEGPTVTLLHQFIADAGKRLRGKHHEIYLSDIRRGAPEKWKTIIRQPAE